MKKLLIVILILISVTSMAQRPVYWDVFQGVECTGFIYNGDTVLISEPSAGEMMIYRNGKWVNESVLDTLVYYEPILDPTPDNPETKFLNGNRAWATIAIGSGGFAGNLYFSSVSSDVPNYKKIDYVVDVAETELTISATTDTTLIRSYLYDYGLQTGVIDAGVWVANYRAKVNSIVGYTKLGFEAFVRKVDNSEITLFRSYSPSIDNTEYLTIRSESNQPSFDVDSTDRLGVRIYALTTRTAGVTINTIIGDGNGSYFATPLRIRHNQLRDLNGDSDYLHISSVDSASWNTVLRDTLKNVQWSDTVSVIMTQTDHIDTARVDNLLTFVENHSINTELDPIFAADSAKLLYWTDTTSIITTAYDVRNQVTQSTATSIDNSLLKTVGTSGRTVEQTGVTIDDSNNITTAGTGIFTPLTDGYIPYHQSDFLGLGNSGIYWDAINSEFELTGNQVLTNTTNASKFGIIYKGSIPFIHDFNYGNNGSVTTDGYNTCIGLYAGNLTMGSTATQTYHSSYNNFVGTYAGYLNTTGYNNNFVGYSAGRSNTTGYNNNFVGYAAGYLNTTGYYNNFVGYSAGYLNTTGSQNNFVGYSAGYLNTTGSQNNFVGYAAGYSNTTGYSNNFVGTYAGYLNTTGYNNNFVGTYAGRYIADGVTGRTTGNNGVYVGVFTKASANGTDNEIVVGYNATGLGSNTVVLGNSSVLTTALRGNIGIGTTIPLCKLSAVSTTATNNCAFNFVQGDINKIRTTIAQSSDTSSFGLAFTSTGSPTLTLKGKTGNTLFKVDSISTTFIGTYAGIYVADASTAQAIATGTTYTKSTAFTTNGSSSNCTADAANDKITITKTGHYLVNCPVSFSGATNNVVWKMAAFWNNVEQNQIHVMRKISTGGDVGSATITGILNVTSVPTDLDIRFRHDQGGSENVTVVYSNLTVTYIGE